MEIKNIEFVHLSNIKSNFDSNGSDELISSFQRINSLGSLQMQGFQSAAFLMERETVDISNDQRKDNNTTSSDNSNHGEDS
jgi:hypothetical protein